ncbi:MAG: NUDIX domain-containing protein [Clostridiales bacterium]|nr:NUDIX domain-containing protein [Clostridiales bacterium]
MEIWDLYDGNRAKTGEKAVRGEPLAAGKMRIVVSVCFLNGDGNMLIQQRQPWKGCYPDLWDISAAGSAIAGENSQDAAQREVMEELGYALDLSQFRPSFTMNFNHGFDDFYILKRDIDLDTLTLQKEEVKAVRWAGKEEILSMIDQGIFVPYHKELIDLIFAMQDHLGAHQY